MRCCGCPLFSSWNNENDRFQYEDKNGAIVGCYIDRHYIEKTDEAYQEHLLQESESWVAWMLEKEKRTEVEQWH